MELGISGTGRTKHRFVRHGWNADFCFSEGHEDRLLAWEVCASLDSTTIQCNTAPVFLDYCMEAEDNVPQILKERAAMRGL